MVAESAGDIEETPDLQGAYPRLNDAQLTTLAEAGRRRAVQPEEILFREGDRDCDFFVILAGKVAVVEGRGTPEERLIGVHGPGRFLGELGLLTGESSYLHGHHGGGRRGAGGARRAAQGDHRPRYRSR